MTIIVMIALLEQRFILLEELLRTSSQDSSYKIKHIIYIKF